MAQMTPATVRLKPLFTRDEIADAVRRIAAAVQRDYDDKNPVLVGVLKGSFIFLADLVRQLEMSLEIDFVRLSSYGAGTQTSGQVRLVQKVERPLKGRHVLVVDDILDSGLTLKFLMDYLARQKPASLRLCVLLVKRGQQYVPITPDYHGLQMDEGFVVGYGLDWDQKYRNLPDICVVEMDGGI